MRLCDKQALSLLGRAVRVLQRADGCCSSHFCLVSSLVCLLACLLQRVSGPYWSVLMFLAFGAVKPAWLDLHVVRHIIHYKPLFQVSQRLPGLTLERSMLICGWEEAALSVWMCIINHVYNSLSEFCEAFRLQSPPSSA